MMFRFGATETAGNNSVSTAINNAPKELSLSCHAILKVDKLYSSLVPKIASFACMRHPSFPLGVYALTSKSSNLTIMQNKSSGVIGEDSEAASSVSTTNEKQRLVALYEIHLDKLLVSIWSLLFEMVVSFHLFIYFELYNI